MFKEAFIGSDAIELNNTEYRASGSNNVIVKSLFENSNSNSMDYSKEAASFPTRIPVAKSLKKLQNKEQTTNNVSGLQEQEIKNRYVDNSTSARYYQKNFLFSDLKKENNIKLLSEVKSKYDIRGNKIEDSSYLNNNSEFFPTSQESAVNVKPTDPTAEIKRERKDIPNEDSKKFIPNTESEDSDTEAGLINFYKQQAELGSQSPIINKKSNKVPVVEKSEQGSIKSGGDSPTTNTEAGKPSGNEPSSNNLNLPFTKEEADQKVTAGLQGKDEELDAHGRAAFRNFQQHWKTYKKNPTPEGLKDLKEMVDDPNSIEPGVMDYVATNPNAVKGVAGGAGLIALTNFLMSDRKGQMTNEELYSQ